MTKDICCECGEKITVSVNVLYQHCSGGTGRRNIFRDTKTLSNKDLTRPCPNVSHITCALLSITGYTSSSRRVRDYYTCPECWEYD